MATKKQPVGARVHMTPDQREAFESLADGAKWLSEREATRLERKGLIKRFDPLEVAQGRGKDGQRFRWVLTTQGREQLALPVRAPAKPAGSLRVSLTVGSVSVQVSSDDPEAAEKIGGAVGELVGAFFGGGRS